MRKNIENCLTQAVRRGRDRARAGGFQRPAFQSAADDAHETSRFAARPPFWGPAAASGPAPARWFCFARRSAALWLFIASCRARTIGTLLRLAAAPWRAAIRVSTRAPSVFFLEFPVWGRQTLRPIAIDIGNIGSRGSLCPG